MTETKKKIKSGLARINTHKSVKLGESNYEAIGNHVSKTKKLHKFHTLVSRKILEFTNIAEACSFLISEYLLPLKLLENIESFDKIYKSRVVGNSLGEYEIVIDYPNRTSGILTMCNPSNSIVTGEMNKYLLEMGMAIPKELKEETSGFTTSELKMYRDGEPSRPQYKWSSIEKYKYSFKRHDYFFILICYVCLKEKDFLNSMYCIPEEFVESYSIVINWHKSKANESIKLDKGKACLKNFQRLLKESEKEGKVNLPEIERVMKKINKQVEFV